MKNKLLATGLLSAAMIAAPLAPASAHEGHEWNHGGWDHDDWHHDHDGVGLGAAIGALAFGAAMIATAPVRVLADGSPGPVYADPSYPGPAPVYAAPAPVYYAPAPAYYAPAPVYAAPTYVYVRHYPRHYVYAPYGYTVYP